MKDYCAALAVLLGSAVAIGQQPAAPRRPGPCANKGRGATPLTPAQSAAVGAANVNAALQPQIQAATAAQAALVEASLTQPVNQADLRAKAQALADAETKLALARADLLVTVQQALRPLDTAQAIAALSGRGGGRGGPAVPDNYDGFVSLFDGRTLDGWNGDPMFWSVKDGALHAESTPEKVVGGVIPGNTFLIWKGKVRDFELKVDYRFVGNGNSGVQIRSRMSGPIRSAGLSARGAFPATSWIWSPPGAPGSGVVLHRRRRLRPDAAGHGDARLRGTRSHGPDAARSAAWGRASPMPSSRVRSGTPTTSSRTTI